MPNRSYTAGNQFRFGFNGQENSNEISNNSTTAEFWQYDARIARRWNMDPRPDLSVSPYSILKSNPILFSDILGDTSVLGAGGKIKIDIDEKYNKLEFYDDGEYGIGNKLVPVKPGQLRSFTNSLGTFTARWTLSANGKYEFTGYLNKSGLTISQAIEKVNFEIAYAQEFNSTLLRLFTFFMPKDGESYEEAGRRTSFDLLLFGVTSVAYPEPGYGSGGSRFSTTLDDMSGLGAARITVEKESPILGIVLYLPPNGGALGQWEKVMAVEEQMMDRYGSVEGIYASPLGTPIEMRALRPSTNTADYFKFKVLKAFPMEKSIVAPAFGKMGLGIQYRLPASPAILEELGYIKILGK